jgi:hypothetical protein
MEMYVMYALVSLAWLVQVKLIVNPAGVLVFGIHRNYISNLERMMWKIKERVLSTLRSHYLL